MDFKIDITNWNLSGKPNDGDICFVVFGNEEDEYSLFIGGYNERNQHFYADMGLSGMVLDLHDVVAWKKCKDVKIIKIKK